MIVIGSNTQNENAVSGQVQIQIDSLQSAIDEINADIDTLTRTLTTLQTSVNAQIDSETQTLLNTLNSQMSDLRASLESAVSTNQMTAVIGNIQQLAVTVSATISALTAGSINATTGITAANLTSASSDIGTAQAASLSTGSLDATVATLGTVSASVLNVVTFIIENLTATNFGATNGAITNFETSLIKADTITGKQWHTPVSLPDNTELLHISIPKYDGSVQILTMNDEFNINIANNYFVAFNQSGEYIYRIERGENSTDIYLMNVGDTINYSILWIGSESHGTVTSEIVDRTQYRQNITTHEGMLDIGLVITNIEILFTDYLPAAGESNILYVIKTQGAYLWNEERSEFIPLMGTDWQDWIGDLTQLTTTAKTSLVDAVNELDSEKYDKTGGNISGDVVVEGLTTLKNDAFAEKNLKVKGDLIVEGQSLITDEQTLATDSNYAVLRKNNPSGLASGEKSGVVIHNYQAGKNASIAVSADGEFRVSDNVAETTTSYTNIAKFGDDYYTGLDPATSATVVSGATVSEDVDEVEDCVLETTGGKWYHFYNSSWYEMYLDSNVLTFDQSDPIIDSALITTLEALTKKNLFYFRSLSVLVISDATDQPLLTREEATDLQNNDLFMWDATNRKATKAPRPSTSGQVLTSTVNAGAVSYQWETGAGDKADLTDLAATFSTSTPYAVGDYVTYNKDLYKCTTAHSGAWNSSHFTAVTVGDMLRLLANTLDTKVDKVSGKGLSTNDFTTALLNKLNGIESGAQVNTVTGVKGNSEGSYRTGNVNITKADIGLGNVDNTADSNKSVNYATSAGYATSAVNSDTVDNYHVSTASGTIRNDSLNALVPVEKQYFSSSGGYIKYSNGLLIQWFRHISSAKNYTFYVPFSTSSSYVGFITSDKGCSYGTQWGIYNREDNKAYFDLYGRGDETGDALLIGY